MKVIVFMLADLWLIFVGCYFGWRFIRTYGNYLLGLEWFVVGFSAINFLVGSLFDKSQQDTFLGISYFLDAFSRSFGITLILVLGLMAVTHGFKPSIPVEIGVFALAALAALYLRHFHDGELHVAPATFYLAANLLTAVFLAYLVTRLWAVGARRVALWTAGVTAAGCLIALCYDFFPFSFDDADRTYFYTAALATWGAQGFVYFLAYRALHERIAAVRGVDREGAHHLKTTTPPVR